MGALEIRKTDSWQSLSIKNGKPETWSSICAVLSRAWKDGTLKVNFLTCACRWTDLRGWRGRSAGGRLDWHGPRGVGVRDTRGGGNLSGMGQNSATVSGCDWILMKCSRQTYVHMCLGSIPTKNSKDNTGKHKNVCNVSAFLPQGGSKCIQFNDLAPYWFFFKGHIEDTGARWSDQRGCSAQTGESVAGRQTSATRQRSAEHTVGARGHTETG